MDEQNDRSRPVPITETARLPRNLGDVMGQKKP